MKIVSIIPARKGSKGIPNKNIVDMCGKPLIYYAINASLKSNVEETWVSSDSQQILDISEDFGCKTIKRPAELSGDEASSESALLHFAKIIDFDILVFIQCTSPLIEHKDINEGIEKMNTYDSVLSVSESSHYFWDTNGPLYDLNKRKRRQDGVKRYLETGSFYITSKKNLLEFNNRISGKIGFVEIPYYRSFEVDKLQDLKIIETIIKSKKYISE